MAMDEPTAPKTRELKRQTREIQQQTGEIKRSAKAVEKSATDLGGRAVQLVDSADRRTQLAGDRTLLAAERTYAAWVRTALAALASGIGARALVKDILPGWVGQVTGTVLIIFAGFCLIAAVWRELQGVERVGAEDFRAIPKALLVPMNLFLLLVAVAALAGIWTA
jgi:putative membrane protein